MVNLPDCRILYIIRARKHKRIANFMELLLTPCHKYPPTPSFPHSPIHFSIQNIQSNVPPAFKSTVNSATFPFTA